MPPTCGFFVQSDVMLAFPATCEYSYISSAVRASQVGGGFASEQLNTAGVARLTEDVIIQRIAATTVDVGK